MMAQRDDPSYHKIAEELFRLNSERLRLVMTVQTDYGKWLIATLSAVHSAAIYAIATSPAFAHSRNLILPSIIGLLLTLVSGLFTWLNFSVAMNLYEGWTDPVMLRDDARWPTSSRFHAFAIPATMISAVVAGVGSGICIAWSAYIFLH